MHFFTNGPTPQIHRPVVSPGNTSVASVFVQLLIMRQEFGWLDYFCQGYRLSFTSLSSNNLWTQLFWNNLYWKMKGYDEPQNNSETISELTGAQAYCVYVITVVVWKWALMWVSLSCTNRLWHRKLICPIASGTIGNVLVRVFSLSQGPWKRPYWRIRTISHCL